MLIKRKTNDLLLKIKKEIAEIFPTLCRYRRYLHQNPEISHKEYLTKEYLLKCLNEIGIFKEEITEIGDTSLLIKIMPSKTKNFQRNCIVLRSDMDALPITEKTNLSFQSKKANVMHACGHDVHMAIQLGTIKLINKRRSELVGPVIFIFEAAEEIKGDAPLIIPYIEDYHPVVYGLHVDPTINEGSIRVKEGSFYGSSLMIDIKLFGEAIHIASEGSNLIMECATFLTKLSEKVEKEEFFDKIILKFGSINGGVVRNITPSEILIKGAIRYLCEEDKDKMLNILKQMLDEMFLNHYELELIDGYPILKNDRFLVDDLKKVVDQLDMKIFCDKVMLTTESFAYYSRKFSSCFYNLGVGTPHTDIYPLHSSHFNPNEEALKHGVLIQTMLVLGQHLKNNL